MTSSPTDSSEEQMKSFDGIRVALVQKHWVSFARAIRHAHLGIIH